MHPLANEHGDPEEIAAHAANSKSKIYAKQEGIRQNVLSSYASHGKGINKKLKGSMQTKIAGAQSWRDIVSCEHAYWLMCSPYTLLSSSFLYDFPRKMLK